jgi:cell wall-associated NlpC family hydrolase
VPIISKLSKDNFLEWPLSLLLPIKKCIGKPYKFNCFDQSGFDCYTLLYYLYALVGLTLPKENISTFNLKVHMKLIDKELVNFSRIKFEDRQPFDLIIFDLAHIGMVLDSKTFIHTNFDTPVVIEYFKGNVESGFIRKMYRWNF